MTLPCASTPSKIGCAFNLGVIGQIGWQFDCLTVFFSDLDRTDFVRRKTSNLAQERHHLTSIMRVPFYNRSGYCINYNAETVKVKEFLRPRAGGTFSIQILESVSKTRSPGYV